MLLLTVVVEFWFLSLLVKPTGTLGNLTSLAVLLRPRMRGKSIYLFLLLLAVADTTVLYISPFKTWIRNVTGFELLHHSSWSCPTVSFLYLVSQHMAAWIVVLVTIDRFVAVWFPLRATTWCSVTRAGVASAICTAVVVVYRSLSLSLSLSLTLTLTLGVRR